MSLMTALEAEQAALSDLMKLEMHMYMTSALSKSDIKGIFLQMALDYFHNKEKRDVITGLKTRTHPGRPDFNKVTLFCYIVVLLVIITYEEQHNKDHIYRTISHVCHNKIVCPLGNFVACDWLS